MIFTIPIKLESESNLQEHWRKRHARYKIQEGLIRLIMKSRIAEVSLPCLIKLTRVAPRALDYDNLVGGAMKHPRDVVADLLIPGLAKGRADGDPRLEFICLQRKGKPKEYALEIEIVSK